MPTRQKFPIPMHRKTATINAVLESQIEQLVQLARTTFYETFSATNSPKTMEIHLNTIITTDRLLKEWKDPKSKFFFIEEEQVPVGFLKLNFYPAQSDLNDPNSLELERIYILKSHQRKNLGQQLLNFAIAQAKESRLDYLWLGVWEHNEKALQFYKRNRFEPFGQHVFKMGDEDQIDLLFKLMLNKI